MLTLFSEEKKEQISSVGSYKGFSNSYDVLPSSVLPAAFIAKLRISTLPSHPLAVLKASLYLAGSAGKDVVIQKDKARKQVEEECWRLMLWTSMMDGLHP